MHKIGGGGFEIERLVNNLKNKPLYLFFNAFFFIALFFNTFVSNGKDFLMFVPLTPTNIRKIFVLHFQKEMIFIISVP